jgi:hypothetical protein
MKTRSWVALGLISAAAWLSPACGGGSDDTAAKTGTGGTSDSGQEADTGGTGGTDAGNDASDSAQCIDANCPGFQGLVAGCCLNDGTCGYDGTQLGLGCVSQQAIQDLLEGGLDAQVPPDAKDPDCDDFAVGGFTLYGCCLSSGFCGVYVPIVINGCFDPATLPTNLQPDTGPPKPCGGNEGGVPDASQDAASDSAAD